MSTFTPAEFLGEQGPLLARVPGYAPRPQQQAMANRVMQTLEQGGILVAEAGTGTGKTFAYLVPALMFGGKVLVSTGTKNLQDQLYHRDLPTIRQALDMAVSVALLKGRSNYLCMYRLEQSEADGRFRQRETAEKVRQIRQWSSQTHYGDIAEIPSIPEDDPVWPWVTSTADNCLGQECACFDKCYLVEARRRAQVADVVIINHHLLFADMLLREEGFADLLPQADAIIVDEAHQLPEVASAFFGEVITANQIMELARDSVNEYLRDIGETDDVQELSDDLQKSIRDLRLAMGLEQRRDDWQSLSRNKSLMQHVGQVQEQLEQLVGMLTPLAERSRGLEKCHERGVLLADRFQRLTHEVSDEHIHWFETHSRSFSIHLTPMDISAVFRAHMQKMPAAWIMTSATLTVADRFDYFLSRLGISDADTEEWESPFDFQKQALMYLPTGLPEPNQQNYTQKLVEKAVPVLKASRGRAFMLFTSYRALNEAATLLSELLPYPLLIQGTAPRDVLIQRFREMGNAVLLGTSSFWEGVDVRGEALSCVIIDKLPFASPGDPVLRARINALKRQGVNAFAEYQLPSAVIMLKQGAGRLIRDVADRGVLMLCDPRLQNKSYGKSFLRSLPVMPATHLQTDVETFYQ